MGKAEDVLDAFQQAIVVDRYVDHRLGLDEGREQDRADAPAARAGIAWLVDVRTRRLVAAGAGIARRFVEGDDQEAVLLERGRRQDARDPGLDPRVGGDEAAGATILTRSIVAIVADA